MNCLVNFSENYMFVPLTLFFFFNSSLVTSDSWRRPATTIAVRLSVCKLMIFDLRRVLENRFEMSSQLFQKVHVRFTHSLLFPTLLLWPLTAGVGLPQHSPSEEACGDCLFLGLCGCWKMALKCLVNFFKNYMFVSLTLFFFQLFFCDL